VAVSRKNKKKITTLYLHIYSFNLENEDLMKNRKFTLNYHELNAYICNIVIARLYFKHDGDVVDVNS
jgi:hypothetical protein